MNTTLVARKMQLWKLSHSVQPMIANVTCKAWKWHCILTSALPFLLSITGQRLLSVEWENGKRWVTPFPTTSFTQSLSDAQCSAQLPLVHSLAGRKARGLSSALICFDGEVPRGNAGRKERLEHKSPFATSWDCLRLCPWFCCYFGHK